jgi:hypothetical protein
MANTARDKILRKRKIRDAVPASLRTVFDKPRLRELTFDDIHMVYKAMHKFFDEDDKSFIKTACSICTKWRG